MNIKGSQRIQPTLSVVVLSHNRIDDLRNNLSLLALGLRDGFFNQLIIVDNASSDSSPIVIKELSQSVSGVEAILSPKNLGVAAGRNLGYQTATGDIIVTLDDDAIVQPDKLFLLTKIFDQQPEAGILTFHTLHATGESQNYQGNAIIPVANYHGAAHAFRRKMLDSVGLLDERCSFGAEELDMSVRAHAAGWVTLYTPQITATHNSFLRSGTEGLRRRKLWMYNYARVLNKHFPTQMALLFTFRYLVKQLRWAHSLPVSFKAQLINSALSGAVAGIHIKHIVPRKTIDFYSDPNLRPEYGNEPLSPWLLAALKRRVFHISASKHA